ncbi:MAG: beta-lactamase family protein [Clostridiales bacterium]|nr:beta-lactamase family protein [Clostridiales bacterium]
MKNPVRLTFLLVFSIAALTLCSCSDNDVRNISAVYYDKGPVVYKNEGDGVDKNTVYELGSCGKTVAAYTALVMADEGILDLDEKIAPFLDKDLLTADPRMNDITLRQLLCHTAGFSPSYELGTDKNIYSDPGSKFCYSGVGYIYMQSVIENKSGMTLDEAASKYVFKPLSMKNSTFENAKTVTPYMNLSSVVLYSMLIFIAALLVLTLIAFIPGKITKFKFMSFKKAFVCCYILAGIINTVFLLFFFVSKVFVFFLICYLLTGLVMFILRKRKKLFYISSALMLAVILAIGFTLPVSIPVTCDLIPKKPNCAYTFKSSAEDMALFCNDLMKKAKAGDEMFAPQVKIDDENDWGLGIAIEHNDEYGTTYWHSGINPGFQSLFVLYPDRDRFVVILTNSDKGLDLAKEMTRPYLKYDGVWDIKRS